jgi:hypothetical protein
LHTLKRVDLYLIKSFPDVRAPPREHHRATGRRLGRIDDRPLKAFEGILNFAFQRDIDEDADRQADGPRGRPG